MTFCRTLGCGFACHVCLEACWREDVTYPMSPFNFISKSIFAKLNLVFVGERSMVVFSLSRRTFRASVLSYACYEFESFFSLNRLSTDLKCS